MKKGTGQFPKKRPLKPQKPKQPKHTLLKSRLTDFKDNNAEAQR